MIKENEAMNNKTNPIYETEFAEDISLIPQDLNDITPQNFIPIVGGLKTKILVKKGEEMISKNNK